MGLFFYTKKGSIISTVDLPTTEIIEPKNMVRNDFYPTNIILGGVFFLHDIMEKLYWDKGGEKWQ